MTYDDPREALVTVLSGKIPPGEGVFLPVLSGSMGPLIVAGCSLRVIAVPPEGTHTGDIVVFRDVNGLTAHRQIIGISLGSHSILYQKGDMNPRGSWLSTHRILGVVAEACDPRGVLLYSRGLHVRESRHEASRQVRRMLLRPVHRLARACARILRGGNAR
jgi:hypothetical protein